MESKSRNRPAIVKVRRKGSPESPRLVMRDDQLIVREKDLPLFVQFAIEQELHHAELRQLLRDNPPFVRDVGLQRNGRLSARLNRRGERSEDDQEIGPVDESGGLPVFDNSADRCGFGVAMASWRPASCAS